MLTFIAGSVILPALLHFEHYSPDGLEREQVWAQLMGLKLQMHGVVFYHVLPPGLEKLSGVLVEDDIQSVQLAYTL